MQKILILILGFLVISCQNAKSQDHTLTAKVKSIEDGTPVFISEYGEGNQVVAMDSLKIEKGKFEFAFPERDYQTLHSIRIDGTSGFVYVINEGESLEMTILKDDQNFLLNEPEIKGGEANTEFVDYMSFLNSINEKMDEVMKGYSMEELQDPETQEVLREMERRNLQEITDYRRKAIKDHPNTLASAYILADIFSSRAVSPTAMKEIYDSLSDEIKDTFIGQELGNAISPEEGPQIGEVAPDFSARNPEGEIVSLEDILKEDGKYTLVEFWASWCPNCQEEMPGLVKVYDEYKDKGLKIIGVSIDAEKSEWEKMIQDYKMDWTQVSNLNQWQDPIVRKYGVTSIPNNYLLDQDGKVVAIKLDSETLKNKLDELLD